MGFEIFSLKGRFPFLPGPLERSSVGLVGRKMVGATSNIRNLFRGLTVTFVPHFNKIGCKTQYSGTSLQGTR